jgi:hypothetical protein
MGPLDAKSRDTVPYNGSAGGGTDVIYNTGTVHLQIYAYIDTGLKIDSAFPFRVSTYIKGTVSQNIGLNFRV